MEESRAVKNRAVVWGSARTPTVMSHEGVDWTAPLQWHHSDIRTPFGSAASIIDVHFKLALTCGKKEHGQPKGYKVSPCPLSSASQVGWWLQVCARPLWWYKDQCNHIKCIGLMLAQVQPTFIAPDSHTPKITVQVEQSGHPPRGGLTLVVPPPRGPPFLLPPPERMNLAKSNPFKLLTFQRNN